MNQDSATSYSDSHYILHCQTITVKKKNTKKPASLKNILDETVKIIY